jgi:hypothetical protein
MSPTKHLLNLRLRIPLLALFATLFVSQAATLTADASDQVLDWIAIANNTAISTNTNPLVTARVLAQLSASVYDAVNGIDPRFQPLVVKTGAPHHASARAAAVQAAYIILVKNYPSLTASLTTQRDASIAALSPPENPNYVLAGVNWGQTVAETIWTIRSADGISPPPPPFVGALGIVGPTAIGVWRPTPLLNATGAGPQFASMTPWVLRRPSQFRPLPPNAVTSAEYATDYNEIKMMGSYNGSARSSDQSELALFWAGNTPLYWDRIAAQISLSHSLSLTGNAHLFALLNVSMADAAIACWDAKYRYVFWRPITAIRGGDTDGNAATDLDQNWTPWLDFFPPGTPAHPEYPSGHSTVSGSAAFILASEFGNTTPFTVTSEVRPGTRAFPSFSAAVAEIADARVFGGIHFRVSCVRGNAVGQAVAGYILSHAMQATDEDGHH